MKKFKLLQVLFTAICLSLFDNTQTTLLNAPGNDLSPEMKTYYEKRLIMLAEPKLVYDQFGDKYSIPKGSGKRIEMRKFDPLPKALTPLTEGVTPHGNKLNVTAITAEVQQFGDYVEHSDMLDLTAIDRVVEQTVRLQGSQAGRTLDTITRDVVTAGTNVIYAPKVNPSTGAETAVVQREDLDSTAKLTVKQVKFGAAVLKRQNTETFADGCYVGIVHPDAEYDLMNDPKWEEWHKYTDSEKMYAGEIGKIAGVRFVESTEAKIFGPKAIADGYSRLHCKTAINSSSTSIAIQETLAALTPDTPIPVYINGVANTITKITTSGSNTTLTIGTAISSLAVGALICGTGGGKDGTAVYGTMIVGQNAYGVTEVDGGGLQYIIKQLGSGGTTDPLNQRSTTGWKATKTAERLVEQYMVRIEHGGEGFGSTAEAN